MQRRLELLAPGGDIDSIKAAIVAGADAVYCGLGTFNARHRATNIGLEDLGGILALAHAHDCLVFVTLNISMVESDIAMVVGLLNKLSNTSIDGVIVQDIGVLHLLMTHYPRLAVHASTQLTTHNHGQIEFLGRLGASRVNLSRELDLGEIQALTAAAHQRDIATEVFVHGSYCLSFSGICYLSSIHGFHSGNRGRCSQPCRDRYQTTPAGKDYPLNLRDNSAYGDVQDLSDAGVDALKIEGRIKRSPYVFGVTRAWRAQLQRLYAQVALRADSPDLDAVFNRGFSNGYLAGRVDRDMFCDDPRNQAARQLCARAGEPWDEASMGPMDRALDEIAALAATAREEIAKVSIERAPVQLHGSGRSGAPLLVSVHTPSATFSVATEACLAPLSETGTAQPLTAALLRQRLDGINDSECRLELVDTAQLQPDLFLPFSAIAQLQRHILFALNGSRPPVDPVDPAVLAVERRPRLHTEPSLAVLVSDQADLRLAQHTNAAIHFQLPSRLRESCDATVALLREHSAVTPWFPAVLIGEDYSTAVDILRRARPPRLVTDNTGIAYQAAKLGIPWLAGPQLNITNSRSMLCLKEVFDCAGAFVSNELSVTQIKRLRPPEYFQLYYSIYHPMRLVTSRQCPIQRITGCDKSGVDDACLQHCERSASLTNLKADTFFATKTKGNYPCLYAGTHSLNTRIATDIPGLFSGLLIDLTDIETLTRADLDKAELIALFERHLAGQPSAARELERHISPTSHALYDRGI